MASQTTDPQEVAEATQRFGWRFSAWLPADDFNQVPAQSMIWLLHRPDDARVAATAPPLLSAGPCPFQRLGRLRKSRAVLAGNATAALKLNDGMPI